MKYVYTIYITDDHDALPILIIGSRKNNPGPGIVPDLLYVDTLPSNQELVVLGLGLDLDVMAGQLLLVAQFLQFLQRFLNVVSWSPYCDLSNKKHAINLLER